MVNITLINSLCFLYWFMELVYSPEFFTSTILNWQPLLNDNNCKIIVLNAIEWLSKNQRCKVNGFVIMPNHLHLIWKINNGFERKNVQGALLAYTAHEFKKYLQKYSAQLKKHRVHEKDRAFQFWERNPMVKECWSRPFLIQKLEYMHNNPCQPKWKLAQAPEDYAWSSAEFYYTGISKFPWLFHYMD
jgi:putative transposase